MAADLFERLKNAKRLPSPPGVALRVLELAQQEDASLVDIANAVSSDPALSAKLAANSSTHHWRGLLAVSRRCTRRSA